MIVRKLLFFLFLFFVLQGVDAQSRKVINLPDISGYITLKCDFHIHTVFSDGTVWPTIRVQEAWEEGLDAIAITDHIEYRPHSKDIVADHNRSYEIAEPLSKQLDILLVRGAEITRAMPPGHLNALFINNANFLEREDVNDAIKEARDQGAFILWNHPGWKAQQPDTTLWWDEHSALLKSDMLHGIEVYNHSSYYPEALDWANEKKLTVFANSDVHAPMLTKEDEHRPMTLVFAKSRTLGGIKEALFKRRTAVYFGNTLMGQSSVLEPLFFGSLDFKKAALKLTNKENKVVNIKNNSDVDYELELVQPGVGFDAPETITLKAHHVTPLALSGNSEEINDAQNIDVYYRVKNMFTDSTENILVTFSFRNN
ncbi:Sb-PDE family phosphodiesterase [Prolixibacteraceae bacterium Z1-6]|uniref:Sb-PDE family phosphodiesterase n=1 Tax=Draconibacterium aestuarii TaxID=2998507 RepID=A0A9X3F6H8_9BACT|nr:Sb-PDE family phosphodiesterase [Prolixibacteraceae bacterium Z1-6]